MPLTAEIVEPNALLPEAPELCRTWELLPLPSVLSRPLVLPKAAVGVPDAEFAAPASAAACAARAAAAHGLASAPLELLRVALNGAVMPPLLLGLLAPSDASSLYSRESSVMVRMCLGTEGHKELCPPKPLLAGCSRLERQHTHTTMCQHTGIVTWYALRCSLLALHTADEHQGFYMQNDEHCI
jgi:hypothetical protein